jgi:hypothetical protein
VFSTVLCLRIFAAITLSFVQVCQAIVAHEIFWCDWVIMPYFSDLPDIEVYAQGEFLLKF